MALTTPSAPEPVTSGLPRPSEDAAGKRLPEAATGPSIKAIANAPPSNPFEAPRYHQRLWAHMKAMRPPGILKGFHDSQLSASHLVRRVHRKEPGYENIAPEDYFAARDVVDFAFHPETKELVPAHFRPSAVPFANGIFATMIARAYVAPMFPRIMPGVFCAWSALVLYHAGFVFANMNASVLVAEDQRKEAAKKAAEEARMKARLPSEGRVLADVEDARRQSEGFRAAFTAASNVLQQGVTPSAMLMRLGSCGMAVYICTRVSQQSFQPVCSPGRVAVHALTAGGAAAIVAATTAAPLWDAQGVCVRDAGHGGLVDAEPSHIMGMQVAAQIAASRYVMAAVTVGLAMQLNIAMITRIPSVQRNLGRYAPLTIGASTFLASLVGTPMGLAVTPTRVEMPFDKLERGVRREANRHPLGMSDTAIAYRGL